MKKYFIVSLIKNGILGGDIVADNESVTYRTGKLTVPQEYRNLRMRYADIESVTEGRFLFLPTVLIKLKNGKEYNFAVFFNRKSLISIIREKGATA